MLLLRSALALVGGAYIISKFVGQELSRRQVKTKRAKGHAYIIVDEMPLYGSTEFTFPHPDYATDRKLADERMLEYIYRRIVYPSAVVKSGTEGSAVITFEVDVQGVMHDMRIARDPGHGHRAYPIHPTRKVQASRGRAGYGQA